MWSVPPTNLPRKPGLEEGLTEPAAQTAAIDAIKDELQKSGMSSAEAWNSS